MTLRRFFAVMVCAALVIPVVACKPPGPKKTCRVNGVCFVCPDEKEHAKCIQDPASARCKWAPPDTCK